ncbi:hypothetical protein TTHERM_00585410 (macronuclear) [Tetrahymena thermophila SB210]|uniref:Uncharacterized protein n=1 Tax=Tetrahymena thermophila (strain SB210) TaxID=312017 RepID=I7LZV4_TETTS|nr:hypothetical protein TTHERM_00585410 [Tetrahymena thermophila SB210]EAR84983.1 hypothetical protein TTHERM_00585410 [Tetrahymena thermophila SB210]|eukprot:XP_001032646.1 hypothetical protein TTHERM_00585410 [Tetrahymena thermophila SB210]
MNSLNKITKKCQKCKSFQPCNNVCLNRECLQEYGALICSKCHQKSHKLDVDNSVLFDQLIQDFEQIFRENNFNKSKISSMVTSNITKIDELMKQLQNMKDQLIYLNQCLDQYNSINAIFNQLKNQKNFDNTNKLTKQLLRSCIYDLKSSPKIKFLLEKDEEKDYLSQLNQLVKQAQIISKKLSKIDQVQNLSEEQLIQEDQYDSNDKKNNYFDQILSEEFTQNNSLISTIKYKSPRQDEFSDIYEFQDKIEEIKQTSLIEINQKLNDKGIPYQWDEFNSIDMHLCSRNVPEFICLTLTDNGFDYLWVRGGYWQDVRSQNTQYGFLDIVKYWTKQKQKIHKLKKQVSSPQKQQHSEGEKD